MSKPKCTFPLCKDDEERDGYCRPHAKYFAPPKEKKKPKPISKVAKVNDTKLWKAFSEFIRRRDADSNGIAKCITCGLIRHWKKLDCGHGIPRQHWGTRYNEKNNHAQCKRCNGFEGGSQEEYAKQVDLKYGDGTWQNLVIFSKMKSKKPSQFEIDTLTELYKKKIELIKKEKGEQLWT